MGWSSRFYRSIWPVPSMGVVAVLLSMATTGVRVQPGNHRSRHSVQSPVGNAQVGNHAQYGRRGKAAGKSQTRRGATTVPGAWAYARQVRFGSGSEPGGVLSNRASRRRT